MELRVNKLTSEVKVLVVDDQPLIVEELCEFLVAKGKKPMFWGDIICAQPELIKELPEETVCLTWGYAAEQREHEAKVMAEAGARQYLCPGVGGWNQWMNLVENSSKNIARMCGYARKYHAEGVLNTDCGDCGHINQPDFSLPGMIYGAVFSWGDDTDSFEELNEQISRLAYGDRSGKFVSYMAKTAECSIFDWWDANVVYEEKVLGHPNNRNALFDARIQDEAKRAAAKETIAALKKELKKTAGALEESCRPMVPVLELTMEAIDIWNETGARLCDIELGKEKDEAACAALAGRPWRGALPTTCPRRWISSPRPARFRAYRRRTAGTTSRQPHHGFRCAARIGATTHRLEAHRRR